MDAEWAQALRPYSEAVAKMMRKQFGFLIAMLLVIVAGSQVSFAQEATATPDAGWPVEERCVGKAIKPPEGWSYDGTILMTGYAGIHGVSTRWDTPRVLAKLSDKDVWGGAVSPDGKWYASPYGERITTETYNTITTTSEIHVYDLTGDTQPIVIEAAADTFQESRSYIYWKDNHTFSYGTNDANYLIDILDSKKTVWTQLDDIFAGYDYLRFSYSPDWARVISYRYDQDEGYFAVLRDLEKQIDLGQLKLKKPTSWKPDSSAFISNVGDNIHYGEGKPSEQLVLYDKNGLLLTTVFHAPEGEQIGRLNTAWSSDGRYFAFIVFDYYVDGNNWYTDDYDKHNSLYVADLQQQRIINTCLATGVGLAWHPTQHSLTFLSPGEGTRDVLILDLDNYELHSVAKHIVGHNSRDHFADYTTDTVLSWRED